MYIEKKKLPKNFGYPLKSSLLESALKEAKIQTNVHLIYGDGQKILFEAFYWLPNQNVRYDRFYIRSTYVHKSLVPESRTKISEIIIPRFVQWAKELVELPADSTRLAKGPHICWTID